MPVRREEEGNYPQSKARDLLTFAASASAASSDQDTTRVCASCPSCKCLHRHAVGFGEALWGYERDEEGEDWADLLWLIVATCW